jgi:hypothetical protein
MTRSTAAFATETLWAAAAIEEGKAEKGPEKPSHHF